MDRRQLIGLLGGAGCAAAAPAAAFGQSGVRVPAKTINGLRLPPVSGPVSKLRPMGRVSVSHQDRSGAQWRASDWSGGSHHASNFDFKHVIQHDGVVDMVHSNRKPGGEAELQEFELGEVRTLKALIDVEFFNLRPGVVAAPFWTYRWRPDGDDPDHADEIDFEVPGRNGLHIYLKRKGKDVFFNDRIEGYRGDLSGRRILFGLSYRLLDRPDDFVAWEVDGREIARIVQGDRRLTGPLPKGAMRPFLSLAGFLGGGDWAGRYVAPRRGQEPIMRIHGYEASRL